MGEYRRDEPPRDRESYGRYERDDRRDDRREPSRYERDSRDDRRERERIDSYRPRGDERGFDRGGDRGYDRGGDRGYDRGYGYDRGGDRGFDRRDNRPAPRFAKKESKRQLTQEQKDESTNVFLGMSSASKLIKIGSIPYRWVERDIREHAEPFGKVTGIIIPQDRNLNRSKGFAFVQFVERRDAQEFFNDMKGRDVDGRAVKVDWDLNQSEGAYNHDKAAEEFKKELVVEKRVSRSPMRDLSASPRRRSRSPQRRASGSPRRHGVDERVKRDGDSRSPRRR
jgi:hypothetical protein